VAEDRAGLFDGVAGVIVEFGGRIQGHPAFALTVAARQ